MILYHSKILNECNSWLRVRRVVMSEESSLVKCLSVDMLVFRGRRVGNGQNDLFGPRHKSE